MALDINATWERSAGATSYKVRVRVNSGVWSEYTVTDNSFYLDGFSLNDFVEASVRGVNDAGQSEWTDIDSVTILGALPNPLSGLTATGTSTGIRLDWNDNATNETEYRIYRSDGGIGTPDGWTWSLLHTTAPNVETYEDVLAAGTTKYYIVIAVSPRGANPTLANSYTSHVTATVPFPDPPTGLLVTDEGSGRVGASWDAVVGALEYEYRYNTDGGAFSLGISTGLTTSFTNLGIFVDNTSVCVQVNVRTINGISDWSSSVCTIIFNPA